MKTSKRVVKGKKVKIKRKTLKKIRKSQTRVLLGKGKNKEAVIKNERLVCEAYKELKIFLIFSAELLDTMSLLALNCETFLIIFLTGIKSY